MTATVCRLLLAGIWLVAAAGKLQQPKAFLRAVVGFDLVPGALVPWVAATMPGVELAMGLVLLAAVFRRPTGSGTWPALADAAAWLSFILLSVFTVALVVNLLRGVTMDCGCFDVLGEHLGRWIPALKPRNAGWDTVARDLVMLVPAALLLRRRSSR